jgi:hypothetical protein
MSHQNPNTFLAALATAVSSLVLAQPPSKAHIPGTIKKALPQWIAYRGSVIRI